MKRSSAPAVRVELRPDGLALTSALLLAALAVLALVAWLWVQLDPQHAGADHVGAAVSIAGLLALLALWGAWRSLQMARQPGRLAGPAGGAAVWQASHLAWDGSAWALVRQSDGSHQPCQVRVRLDAGSWLLLRLHGRFDDASTPSQTWSHWIALSDRSLPSDWHALRCALYCPTRTPSTLLNDR